MPQSQVTRIERIQNKTLWYGEILKSNLSRTFYYVQRKYVTANNKGTTNERFLFHGSRVDAYEAISSFVLNTNFVTVKILSDGFDHRVANLGGRYR